MKPTPPVPTVQRFRDLGLRRWAPLALYTYRLRGRVTFTDTLGRRIQVRRTPNGHTARIVSR